MRAKRNRKTPESSFSAGDMFLTASGQLRKVVEVEFDKEGRNRVRYVAKGSKIKGQPFSEPYPYDNPPLESTFMKACCHRLSGEEVTHYLMIGVLTTSEVPSMYR